ATQRADIERHRVVARAHQDFSRLLFCHGSLAGKPNSWQAPGEGWPPDIRPYNYYNPKAKACGVEVSLETRSRIRTPYAAALDLPRPFRLVTLREAGDAFAHATTIAAEAGAGTLVWVGRFDLVEFALVLEPDEPLATARRAFYAGMAALADALLVHAP